MVPHILIYFIYGNSYMIPFFTLLHVYSHLLVFVCISYLYIYLLSLFRWQFSSKIHAILNILSVMTMFLQYNCQTLGVCLVQLIDRRFPQFCALFNACCQCKNGNLRKQILKKQELYHFAS